MFVAHDAKLDYFVFTDTDPREDGFEGFVEVDVSIQERPGHHDWPLGAAQPRPVLGVSTSDPKAYRVFSSEQECRQEGFRVLGMNWTGDFDTYGDYLRGSGRGAVKA